MAYNYTIKRKNFRLSIFITFLLMMNIMTSWGQILINGDMEQWTGSTPDGWTTIDGGITTSQESTIIHGGTYSASIDVTTEKQEDTDFRQTVSLTNGHDYHVSVWVYHTEGNMKARLYVGEYRNYSNNSNTGSWQEITYDFTASSTSIEVGLRFYDQSGFDGSEIVYVDDFVITDLSAGSPSITVNPTSLTDFTYIEGNGPSTEQSFTVEGSDLTDDIKVTSPANWEISLTSGGTFQTTAITLAQSGGTVSNTTIYTRMISGLTHNNSPFSGNIACESSADGITENITVDGTVTLPDVFFNVSSATISENGTTYTIEVTSNATGSHTADLIVNGGTATNGNEYSFTSPVTVDFTSSTSFITDVIINNNESCDGDTNVVFELTNPNGCSIGTPNQLDLTIIDDDQQSGEYLSARFEGNDTWNYTTSATIENDVNKHNDAKSLRLANGAESIEFDNISIAGFTDVAISVAYAATGVDSGEDLFMEISYDGGANYTESIQLVNGYSDLNLNINDTGSSERTPQGANPYTFNVPAGKTSVRVRFTCNGLDSGEYYYIDDVILTRTSCNICQEPTTDATFDLNSPQNLTGVSATLNWTNGDGSNRIVVMRAGSDVSFVPADNTSYTANAAFGTGQDISGNGEYVIYNGNDDTVDISNLTPGTLYYVKIFEYSCNAGSKDYYISGTPASDVFYTVPENPNTFEYVCVSNTSIDLSWTAPDTGNYDGYLLVVREGATPHSVNSLDPNTNLNENLDYTLAATYGSTSPNSRILYKGTDTSATVTGLTQGTSYTFKVYAYSANGSLYIYSTGKTTTKTIDLPDVSTALSTAGDMQVELGWTIPNASCFDEILVVANETSGIDFTPSGDGSSYTANTVYAGNNSIVFKGTGNNLIVTGLTNGITYYFEIFVRKGTQWSSGVEVSETPVEATILKQGDLAIMAVNTDIDNDPGGNGDGLGDQIVFVCFKDIKPGTKIYLTDNGYEREVAEKWGNTEGVIAITRLNSTLTKGTFITIEANDNTNGNILQPNQFDVYTCGNIDSDWQKEYIAGNGGFNLNDDDDVWIMQGGIWLNGISNNHDAVYTGNVLYGWTESGWDNGVGSGSNGTKWSSYYPQTGCFTTIAPTGDGKVKFNDPNDPDFSATDNDQLDWISLINTTGNWDTYSSNGDYNSSGFDYKGNTDCPQMTIAAATHTAGKWKGEKNENWFDCSNWDNLTVPNENTDVIIPGTAVNNLVIDPTAKKAEIYNNIAQAKDLKIESGHSLTMTSASILEIYGNWDNVDGQAAFIEGNGKIIFKGRIPQTVNCKNGTETEKFYDLEIDNPQSVLFSSGNIHAEGTLNLMNSPSLLIPDGKYILANKGLINHGVSIHIQNKGAFVQKDNSAGIIDHFPANYSLTKDSHPLHQYYEYVYWSSPIKQGSLTLGDIISNAWAYYEYDPADISFANYPGWIAKNETDVVEVPKAYAISAPAGTTSNITLTPTFSKNNEAFNTGDIRYTLKLGTDDDPSGDDDYNLIGNPYPSALDFNAFAKDNPTVEGSYYAWTNCAGLTGNRHQEQGYSVYSVSSGSTAACDPTGLKAGRYIATAQGFMIEAINSGSVVFKNSQRVIGNNDNFINKPKNLDRIWLNLTNAEGLFNQILIAFSPQATKAYDRLFDAHNLEGGTGQEFYSISNNEKFAIQGLPLLQKEERQIQLGLKQEAEASVTFHINKIEGILTETYIYLWDKEKNIYHDLKSADYITIVAPGESNDRFELILRRTALNSKEVEGDNQNILIIQNQNSYLIKTLNENKIHSVSVMNMLGQVLLNKKEIHDSMVNIKVNISKGNLLLFRVKTEDDKLYTKKILVK